MTNNDISQFQTSANQDNALPNNEVPISNTPTPEQLKEIEQKGTVELLNLIKKNKKAGIENLQKSLDALDHVSTNAEVNNIKKGLSGVLTYFEAIDSLLDMMINDIRGIFNESRRNFINTGNLLQTVVEVLKDKNVIKIEEVREKWKEIVESVQKPPEEE